MEEVVKNIFNELFEVKAEDFNEELDVDSVLGWDSANHLNLVTSLEELLDISFTTDEVIKMISVKSILEVLRGKGA